MKKLKVASFFAGIGGIDHGFLQANFDVVYANEFDKFAVKTYEVNSDLKVDCRDIRTVSSNEIPNFDVLVGGFPCQAFSTSGKRQGFLDEKNRGTLCYELFRIIKDKRPKAFFLENVKGLIYHNAGETLNIIVAELIRLGYNVTYKLMNAVEYGNVPQNRERIYIVGFKNKKNLKRFRFPEKIKLTNTLDKCIAFDTPVDEKYYCHPGSLRYDTLINLNIPERMIYAYSYGNFKKNKDMAFCLTASGRRYSLGVFRDKTGMRTFTPKECLNLQGYPKDFIIPENVSDHQIYKQAGNSVCVSLIKRIADNIRIALD